MTSRYESLPRKIKWIPTQKEHDPESKHQQSYQFYRTIIHPSILRLNNEKEKLNYALWLNRLDNETASERRMHLIKIVFISLKRNRPFYIFLGPPPEDLSELNLDADNTVDMIEFLHSNDARIDELNYEKILQKTNFKRFAAVATDMNSYTTSKISKYLAQSFYVMSDFPINTWYNPTNILTPDNLDHNQWELFLNHFEISSEDKNLKTHKNTCDDIMKLDQVSKEGANTFIWHPHSVLKDCNRPKRSVAFKDIDQDIQNQPLTQQQMEESAFSIVHMKTFPGYKVLNPRVYSTTLMPDPEFVFNTTGVKITYNKLPRSLKEINKHKTQDENTIGTCCQFNQQKNENSCVNDVDKTNIISVCTGSTKQLPCLNKVQNKNDCQKLDYLDTTTQTQIERVKAGNSSEVKLNEAYTLELPIGCGMPSSGLKLMSNSLDSENRRRKCDPRNSSHCDKQSRNNKHFNQTNTNQTRVRNDQSKVLHPNHSSFDDSSHYDQIMSRNEMVMDQTSVPFYVSTPRNPRNQSHRTNNWKSQNDQLSGVKSTNQNLIKKNNNHNDEQYTNQKHRKQKSRHNKTNAPSHLDQSHKKGCKRCSNNESTYQKSRPRSLSVPSHSNKLYKSCCAKREWPHCENENNKSCPIYEESKKNKTCNIPKDNTNKLVMPKCNCNKNDKMCSPRYYDDWDIDVGNNSEFSNKFPSEKQNQSMRHELPLNNTTNYQNELSETYATVNSNDWSDEISQCNAFHSCNSIDSLSTLTTLDSSSNDSHQSSYPSITNPIRSDYRKDLTLDLNHFRDTKGFYDGMNFNNRFDESMNMDSEGYDFTSTGSQYPFDNTQQLDRQNLNLHRRTRRQDEINYNNNNIRNSISSVSEGHDFTDEEIPFSCDNPQQFSTSANWPIISGQNNQDIDEFNLSYRSNEWEHSTSDESFKNGIEGTRSPHAIHHHRSLRNGSFRELDIENTSMPELSYDYETSFLDYDDSMDDDYSNDINSCKRN